MYTPLTHIMRRFGVLRYVTGGTILRSIISLICILTLAVFCVGCFTHDLLRTVPAEKKPRVRGVPALISWAKENGARFNRKFSIQYIDGFGLGLVAGETIAEGERYLTIDTRLLIGRDTVLKDTQLAPALATLPRSIHKNTKLLLALFLLHHKHAAKNGSFWWPYISTLPDDYCESPFFWNDDDLETLKGSYIYKLVASDRVALSRQFETLKTMLFYRFPNLFPGTAATLDEFFWAVWSVRSRLFYIEGLMPREHLVPLADMINCMEPERPVKTSFVEKGPEDNQVQLLADRNVAAGQQIFESYGAKSGLETLYYEGFFLEPPVNDCVWINLSYGTASRGPRWRCVGKEYIKKSTDLERVRASVQNALSENTFETTLKDSDNTATRFRRQEKRLMTGLLDEIEKETMQRREMVASVHDPSLPLSSRPTGFFLDNRCGNNDGICLQKKADTINQWIKNLGAVLKVKVAPVPDMRMGAVATMPISMGDIYIKMPSEALLDDQYLEMSPLRRIIEKVNSLLIKDDEKTLDQYERLRLLLLTEARKEERSAFAPYLNALPEDFSGSPITWGYAALHMFDFSRAGAYAARRRRIIIDHFRRFKKYVISVDPEGFNWVSFDDFVWASLILFTRCIWWEGSCHLVPVLDMVNCSAGTDDNQYKVHQTRFDQKSGTAVTRARGNFNKGEQVFENYGQPNVIYAFKHGFVLDNNPQDTVWVRVGRKSMPVGPGRIQRLVTEIKKTVPDKDPREVLAGAVERHLRTMEKKRPVPGEQYGAESAPFKLAVKLYNTQRRVLFKTLVLLNKSAD